MCLNLLSVNAGAQLFQVTLQIERASAEVPFAVKSAKYSVGSDGQAFAIADCSISLLHQSFLEARLPRKQIWGNQYYNGVFSYHDFLATSPPPQLLTFTGPHKLPWDTTSYSNKAAVKAGGGLPQKRKTSEREDQDSSGLDNDKRKK
jgi:hypothetical protein